jgi:hypothetical protein
MPDVMNVPTNRRINKVLLHVIDGEVDRRGGMNNVVKSDFLGLNGLVESPRCSNVTNKDEVDLSSPIWVKGQNCFGFGGRPNSCDGLISSL